jgi:hypothetical protein
MGIWLIREDPDPNFSTALHRMNDGAAGSLDLAGSNPTGLERLQAVITEADLGAPQSFAAHATTLLFAPLYTLWHQHRNHLFSIAKSNTPGE